MSDGIVIDTSGIQILAADLGKAPANAGPLIYKAFQVAAFNIKGYWKQNLPKDGAAKALPYAIDFDIGNNASIFRFSEASGAANLLEAQIGPDKGRKQGALGNLLEYGSINNAAEGEGAAALQSEQEDFQRGIFLAIDQAMRENDL